MGLVWLLGLLVVFTLLPGLEARASIPLAFFHPAIRSEIGLPLALAVCFGANLLVGIMTFWLMGPVVQAFRRWIWFDRVVWPRFERSRQRLHPYVVKYGEWGLAFFIGMPLPGTGAYTGAFGAFLLGFDKRRFLIANLLGVLCACVVVSAICVLIDQGIVAEKSVLRDLFLKQVAVDAGMGG